jgi:hypothetical protein
MMEQPPHVCRPYRNVRGEVIDPAQQGGIGCPICWPDEGRVVRLERRKNQDVSSQPVKGDGC